MNTTSPTTDPARASLSGVKRAIFEAFVENGAMTDDELVTATGIIKGTSSPRRGDLVKEGIVEEVGSTRSASGRPAKQWNIVPIERRGEAKERGRKKKARRRPVTEFTLDERLEMARQLLDMDDVNDAIRHGRAWSRVRGRAQDRKGERRRQILENDAALREAERQGAPLVEFYKLRRALLDAAERVRGVRRLVDEELDRTNDPGSCTISHDLWPSVADLLTDLSAICDDTNQNIRTVMGVLGDDVIDAEAFEIEIEEVLELPEG